MSDGLRYSKSQALAAIKGIELSLSGNIHDQVLTAEQIKQLRAIRDHLKAAHAA